MHPSNSLQEWSMGIKNLAPVHVQMLDWIIANPHRDYGELAAEFGYTRGWVSQIIHSDAFRALLAERQGEMFSDVRVSVKDRIVGLAHESLNRLTEKMATEQDTDKIRGAADIALKALGFGARSQSPGIGTINAQNVVVAPVDAQTLAHARELMHRSHETEKPPLEAIPVREE